MNLKRKFYNKILCCYIISAIFYYYIIRKNEINTKLLTVLFACDRNDYLNITLNSFFNHINKYERIIVVYFYLVDSGTSTRLFYIEKYNIKNYFFLNPTNPEYTYNMFWSYLHGEFVLFLEDDRPFIKNIEKKIFYPNFIDESILILKIYKYVKGIILKQDRYGNITTKEIKTSLGSHTLCILINPPLGYYYANGPAVYNVKYLLQTVNFVSERYMARMFYKLKWFTGFTYKGIRCKSQSILTTACQGISLHLNSKTTQGKSNICKNYMY